MYVDPEKDLIDTELNAENEGRRDYVANSPRDTYFDFSCGPMEECHWLHGSVFINGFNVGRYHKAGPQQTLYIPGPLLNSGENQVIGVIFE